MPYLKVLYADAKFPDEIEEASVSLADAEQCGLVKRTNNKDWYLTADLDDLLKFAAANVCRVGYINACYTKNIDELRFFDPDRDYRIISVFTHDENQGSLVCLDIFNDFVVMPLPKNMVTDLCEYSSRLTAEEKEKLSDWACTQAATEMPEKWADDTYRKAVAYIHGKEIPPLTSKG